MLCFASTELQLNIPSGMVVVVCVWGGGEGGKGGGGGEGGVLV